MLVPRFERRSRLIIKVGQFEKLEKCTPDLFVSGKNDGGPLSHLLPLRSGVADVGLSVRAKVADKQACAAALAFELSADGHRKPTT